MEGPSVFHYKGGELVVTEEMKARFREDGFILVRGMASRAELDILEESVQGPQSVSEFAFAHADPDGKQSTLCLWNTPGEDTVGLWARSAKMINTAAQLLNGDVYHYHSKLMMKNARTGGKFIWHQDYGYWYDFACYYPDLVTTFLAIDKCSQENGCLEVLKGSHRCGRLNHTGPENEQQGADVERVKQLEKFLPKVLVEMEAGDALIFHCNLLHTSQANNSDYRRWALLTAYNKVSNKPNKDNIHGLYQPTEVVANDTVIRTGVHRTLKGKNFLTKEDGKYKVVSF